MGLTSYYRKFIKGYGKIAKSLTELTKKDGFLWCSEAHSAFENLKKIRASAPVLALPNFSQPFEIKCNASRRGIRAMLMQSQRPIAYFSKALSDQNLNKSAYEKEIMALVLAIQHWRPYLLGRSFTIFTDQKSLKFLFEQRITTIDQQN
ncbi:RNA-directed DNA polymerase, reverse transcriptase [Tanacetum coccineum]